MGKSFSPITCYQKILVNVNTTKTPLPKPKNIRENMNKFKYIKVILSFLSFDNNDKSGQLNTYNYDCKALNFNYYRRQHFACRNHTYIPLDDYAVCSSSYSLRIALHNVK